MEPGPAPGWDAGDFFDEDRYLCIEPREVFGLEEDVYADAQGAGGGPDEDNDNECMENDDEEVPPTAGPSMATQHSIFDE
ncbi:hypothetical protein NLJ89_g12419 [Agrocybe chaxingu]|uniref:Uncharacterized protein n=1 Tax=Agrocybe chaxingu TaxID=84603 RepID=A0A9W8MM65_9AGAR|nr:hypothetical protein NLJ89_g12419 [Agrocybe chaxingu]